jgi:hypothetical protein
MQRMCKITMRRVRATIVVVERHYSECVFAASVIQHAKRMRRVILSLVAFLALPYFYTLSHKRLNFRIKTY